jgi:DNA-binding response OmpR family regulator
MLMERTSAWTYIADRATRKTILLASRDAALTDARKRALQAAGYHVIAAKNVKQIASSCRQYKIDLVLIGASLPPAEKRRFWAESRDNCKTPILELYGAGPPELMDETRTLHRAHTSLDFIEIVRAILTEH